MQRRQRNTEGVPLREEEHDKRIKTESKYRDRAAERRTGREETNENEEEFPITEAKAQVSQLIAKRIAQMYTKSTRQGVIANQQPQNDFTLAHADAELVQSINFSKKVSSLLHNEDDGEEFSKEDVSNEEEEEEDDDFDMFALANKPSLDSLSKDELVAMLHRVEDAMELKMKTHHQ